MKNAFHREEEMLDDITAEIKLTQRSNFSVQHIMAAARFARQCFKLEEENKGKILGPFYDDVISYTTAAVFSSVASLEANINEIYADILDGTILVVGFDNKFVKEFWALIEEKAILDKYQFLLIMKGLSRLTKGVYEYQAVDILIRSRNALVHFKPEWQHNQIEHKKIGCHLTGKFQMSPFISESAPIFPVKCMTHGFAKWAVDSTIKFVKWYSDLAGVPFHFDKFLDRIATE